MRILLCHGYYQQRGGEDQSFEAEANLLEARGNVVLRYTLHNDEIARMGPYEVARKTVWNRHSYREMRDLIRRQRPDVMHCTNTFPLISPAAYYAARAEGVPVVQSLHNYRLLCANSLLLRDGRPCETCLGKRTLWPAIRHRCYRGSRLHSAGVAAMVGIHRFLKTWSEAVDLYCTPSEFARQKFIEGGIAADRIVVKPNFVDDLGLGNGKGGYVVYVGRLSHEKGVELLLQAWQRLNLPVRLKVIGDGPLADRVAQAASADERIEWLGRLAPREVAQLIGDSLCVVLPSICYETFGRTVIEAYCKGTPVIASDLGALAELVHEGETGYLFSAGDADHLLRRLATLLEDPRRHMQLRRAARREYERKYTDQMNYKMLMRIYGRVLGRSEATENGRQPDHGSRSGPDSMDLQIEPTSHPQRP
jgi:glycosyltransferase involved in cell wall biosynthesis